MHDYKKRYFELFNKVSEAIELLQVAQLQMEEAIIADESPERETSNNFPQTP